MSETIDLGPLTLAQEGDTFRFTLSTPDEISLELPAGYEQQIAEKLASVLVAAPNAQCVMDLEDIPGISSRQLGLMLALHKAVQGHTPRLVVTGVSETVRRLLDVTRTAQFFEYS